MRTAVPPPVGVNVTVTPPATTGAVHVNCWPDPAAVPPVDLSQLTPELVATMAVELGLAGGGGPGGPGPVRMAPVNAILQAAPPKVREWLLVEFLSLLQSNADL